MIELVLWLAALLWRTTLYWVKEGGDPFDSQDDGDIGGLSSRRVDRHLNKMKECFEKAMEYEGRRGGLKIMQRKVHKSRGGKAGIGMEVLPIIDEEEEFLEESTFNTILEESEEFGLCVV